MIYDITQPLFECKCFPGDSRPEKFEICKIENGDAYNLTSFTMCAHNGTHVDAPYHFYQDGKTIDEVSLDRFVGLAYVEKHDGDVTESDAIDILERARAIDSEAAKRILLGGKATVTLEAAKVFAEAGTYLLGNESQTVGPEDSPRAVHLVLLAAEVVLLEGVRLENVPDGVYLLNCAPINLTGADGGPCRATLIEK